MGSKLHARLLGSARRAGVTVTDDQLRRLAAYLELLSKWNARVNLTSLGLSPLTDAAVERLITEPLAALKHVPNRPGHWFDLGSGGGSPALPLKVVAPWLSLTMVEARTRKAAFLREAIRTLELDDVAVENRKFEDVAQKQCASAGLATIRAVKVDAAVQSATALLQDGGVLLLFRSDSGVVEFKGLDHQRTAPLLQASRSYIAQYVRRFHVEQSG